jgi:predicted transcriptional regulator YdeE
MNEPTFVDRPAFTVMGVGVRINPMAADYDDIWMNQFEPRAAEIAPFAMDESAYGVYFPTDEEGMVEMVAGLSVAGVMEVPEGLVAREVPAAHEAVFECAMDAIGPAWGHIMGEWAMGSGYVIDPTAPAFERFPPGSGPEGNVPVCIHVAVKGKG